ncbi:MAG: hypothetical protein LC637_00340 [Xanthomonadaceae bacterium]|nr:hypothetical protein [Xanthomonadaceae bacterium]
MPSPLGLEERELYLDIIEWRNHWEAVLAAGATLPPAPSQMGFEFFSELVPLDGTRDGDSSSCPSGITALQIILDPQSLGWAQFQIRDHLTNNLGRFSNQQPWYRRISGGFRVGLSRGPLHGGLTLRMSQADAGQVTEMETGGLPNEVGTGNDVLSWDIDLGSVGLDGGALAVDIDLNIDKSWVNGVQADRFVNGQVQINNECVLDLLQRLEAFRSDIEFQTPPGSGIGGLPPPPPPPQDAGGGSTTRSCFKTVGAYVNGELQYTLQVATLCDG